MPRNEGENVLICFCQKSEKSYASVSYETDLNVLGNTWKVFLQSNVLNIVESLVTPEWQEYNIRLICKICEQQEVNNDEKFKIGELPSLETQGQLVGR